MQDQTPFCIDDERYQRFPESRTAFAVFGREGPWQPHVFRRRQNLTAQGYIAPRVQLEPPEDALFWRATSAAFATLDELLSPMLGLAAPQVRALWETTTADSDTLPQDPDRLTTMVKWIAQRLGADLVGVATTDPRWIYADVASRQAPHPRRYKPVHIVQEDAGAETGDAFYFPKTLKYTIVVAVAMDREMIMGAPTLTATAATDRGYSKIAQCILGVARFIHTLGYRALPCLNDTALSIPMAIQAGLGELGRNGLLIHPLYGPCLRLAKIYTDMPLRLDRPRTWGISRFCHHCQLCAMACPAQAISDGEPTWEGYNESNNPGVLKWYIDPQRCLRYWLTSGTWCGTCIASCPFTWGDRWAWGWPQRLIEKIPSLNRIIARWARRTCAQQRTDVQGYLTRLTR